MIRLIAICLLVASAPALAVYGGGDRTEAEANAAALGVGVGIGEGGEGGDGGEGHGLGIGTGVGLGGNADGGTGIGGDQGQQQVNGDSKSLATNGNQQLTNVYQNHYRYRAPIMASNTLLMNSTDCKTFLGVQMTGANKDGAGGMGLGIPFDDKDCKLDKATRLAWAGGNTQLGWELFCSQPSLITNRAHMLKVQGVEGRGVRRGRAYTDCLAGAVDWKATLDSINVEINDLTAILAEIRTQPGFDDSELRARLKLLESAAHRPRTTSLLIQKAEE